MLISVIAGDPEFDALFELVKRRFESFVLFEIQPLNSEEISLMQDEYLKSFKRTLQPTQENFFRQLLLNEISEKQTVFRNRLFLSIAKGLNSYSKIPPITPSTEGALTVITEKLFAQHGKLFAKVSNSH